MKIAWFSDTWLPTRDGVVNSLLSFKEELERRGHQIFLFVPGDHTRDDRRQNIFYYRARPFRPYPAYRMPPLRSLLSPHTRRLLAAIQPDLVHAHSPGVTGLHGLLAARRQHLPYLFTYHTFLQDSVYLVTATPLGQQVVRRLLLAYLKWFFGQCTAVVVPSQAAREELAPLISVPLRVVPTGVDVERFAAGDGSRARRRLGLNDRPLVLHVGRVVREKNLDHLLAAAPLVLASVPHARFVVVGTGPYLEELRQKAQRQGLAEHVLFTGFVEEEDLPHYYAAADVFAFPSTYETQGIVALEAMAAGTPVVAARSRSLPELVEEGRTGFLFEPRLPADLADKLVQTLRNPSMADAARRTAGRYSQQRCTDRLMEVYEEFI
ncbi:MAG TPA: glycosyltransferase family 4 protein [Thermoplasmatales archaeon]|nr:glycosyltransferase family 4 protein [Thermoplasmatales archaeon]